MSEIYRNASYKRAAARLMETMPELEYIRESGARIAYLSSTQEKKKDGKAVCGECMLIPKKFRWCIPYDFQIVLYEPNIADFSRAQIRILLFHELLHVGIDNDKDEPEFRIRPHDAEEFNTIIDRYGLYWDAY